MYLSDRRIHDEFVAGGLFYREVMLSLFVKRNVRPAVLLVQKLTQLTFRKHHPLSPDLLRLTSYSSENRDPVVKILGSSYASILEKEDAHTDVLSLVAKEEDQGKDSEVKVKLFLLLQNMDNQLLSKCLKEISE